MKAIGNNIIILPRKVVTDKTKGGLILIEKDKEDIRYKQAIIASVSEDIKVVEVGDEIYYDKHAGHGIEFEGTKYTVIKLQDIVIVL
jgi:co-chaperonin GroES (HSP10)